MSYSLETKLRAMGHNRARIFLTKARRSQRGFVVTGPDGQLYRARTRKEALNNLLARLKGEGGP